MTFCSNAAIVPGCILGSQGIRLHKILYSCRLNFQRNRKEARNDFIVCMHGSDFNNSNHAICSNIYLTTTGKSSKYLSGLIAACGTNCDVLFIH